MPWDLKKGHAQSTEMNYLDKWKQEILMAKNYSPKLWATMSFILPLALVPVAAKVAKKGYEYAKKKLKK